MEEIVKKKKRNPFLWLLNFIASIVYPVVAGYLVWLLFYYITPFVMSFGWIGFFVLLFIAMPAFIMLIYQASVFIMLPMAFIRFGGFAKVIAVAVAIYFGFALAELPWYLDMDYTSAKYALGILLNSQMLISVISFLTVVFKNKDEI